MNAHKAAIIELVIDQKAHTRGFRKRLEKATEASFAWWKMIPDAYQLGAGLVIAYEVEDTHRVSMEKLRAYGRLWAELDELGWELKLVVQDIRGGTWEPNMADAYFTANP